jgi:hypothetical protein
MESELSWELHCPESGRDGDDRPLIRKAAGQPFSMQALTKWECDFVTDAEAIQVCADLNSRNREREVRGAVHAAALPGRRRAVIPTLNQRDRIVVDGTTDMRHSQVGSFTGD